MTQTKTKLIQQNSFHVFFSENIGAKIDIKSHGMRSRQGKILKVFSDFVLIEYEWVSSFCPGGEFYVCYKYIVDFAIIKKQGT